MLLKLEGDGAQMISTLVELPGYVSAHVRTQSVPLATVTDQKLDTKSNAEPTEDFKRTAGNIDMEIDATIKNVDVTGDLTNKGKKGGATTLNARVNGTWNNEQTHSVRVGADAHGRPETSSSSGDDEMDITGLLANRCGEECEGTEANHCSEGEEACAARKAETNVSTDAEVDEASEDDDDVPVTSVTHNVRGAETASTTNANETNQAEDDAAVTIVTPNVRGTESASTTNANETNQDEDDGESGQHVCDGETCRKVTPEVYDYEGFNDDLDQSYENDDFDDDFKPKESFGHKFEPKKSKFDDSFNETSANVNNKHELGHHRQGGSYRFDGTDTGFYGSNQAVRRGDERKRRNIYFGSQLRRSDKKRLHQYDFLKLFGYYDKYIPQAVCLKRYTRSSRGQKLKYRKCMDLETALLKIMDRMESTSFKNTARFSESATLDTKAFETIGKQAVEAFEGLNFESLDVAELGTQVLAKLQAMDVMKTSDPLNIFTKDMSEIFKEGLGEGKWQPEPLCFNKVGQESKCLETKEVLDTMMKIYQNAQPRE